MSFKILLIKLAVEPFPFVPTIEIIFFGIEISRSKIKSLRINVSFNSDRSEISSLEIFFKTLGFTYLNPHVYSDTVFFLGNFSKNFLIKEKIFFGIGASIASFIFFFIIGYLSKYLSRYAQNKKTWQYINLFIICFMSLLTIYITKETLNFFW